ncbi:PREDICTED: gamma-aminobutyric acid type B receptor subunit 2-like [Amphimedon queenslandica]|uniref:G-protein coupled receptors family 3 profile domain-containing protein n=1 Tax=Amphimedon queenslandica TaxID=400682 RepID=A0A1X7VFQ3_AMPQE|nr:PREDICTED: gamma-aminobutyric acid type B receptor subunit 2-like [Amphimedon queenslandica]XP_019849132.1 PREDICTED: gamma-aminobutyric acid type B receptor subunit 2-like [Amphimedon queenslandica]|eukprot:XP_019849131.1 PREDICTED: gamma-aminobutyric acid type B receptor subunit 2-like [Amphimedon queenslandica]
MVSATALLLYLSSLLLNAASQRLDVYIVYSNSGTYNSTPALLGATDAIAAFSNELLPQYSLNITPLDDKCNASRGLQETLQYVSRPSPFVSIIGGGCPSTTSPLLEIAEYLKIPLISYNPGLMRYSQNYVQVFPSRVSLVSSLAAVISEYGWSQISVITEVDDNFLKVEYALKLRLKSENVKVLDTVHMRPQTNITADLLFRTEARVFFLNTYQNTARRVLCTAHRNNTYYPGYAWLIYDWYNEDWYLTDDSSGCMQREINEALDRAITIRQHKEIRPSEMDGYAFAYDAMVSLMRGLNRTQSMIDEGINHNTSCPGGLPSSINETSNISNCVIRSNIIESAFQGKSGDVSFTSDGIRKTIITYVSQYRENGGQLQVEPFATVNVSESLFNYFSNESNSTVWPDGVPPDGTPIYEFSSFSIILVIVMYLWSSVGIIFTVICLIFNIIFRNRKIIRLTSPNLNYFIIAGAIILYSLPFVTLQPSNAETVSLFVCIANIWMLSLGITSIFAPMLAKMFRIYRIFRNPRANKKVLTDWHLFFFVFILEGILIFILFLGTAIPFTRPEVSYSEDPESPPIINEDGIKVIYQGVNCYHAASLVWIFVIYIYILILEAIAVVLAAKTRGVKVEAVNDSKEVVAIVYIVTACSVSVIIIVTVLSEFTNISEGLYLTAALIGTTSTVTLMFLPKMWSLYKDPTGENVFEPTTIKSSSGIQSQIHRQDSEKIVSLQREVGTLKKILRENSVRLMSVPEAVNEIDGDESNNKNGGLRGLTNSCSQLPEVFGDPLTPGDEEKTL